MQVTDRDCILYIYDNILVLAPGTGQDRWSWRPGIKHAETARCLSLEKTAELAT